MLHPEHYRKYVNRQQWRWWMLGALLVMSVLAWLSSMALTVSPMWLVLTVCAMGLVGYSWVLRRQLQQTRTQRDQAGGIPWAMCVGLREQAPCTADCAMQRVHALQREVADLRNKTLLLQVQADHDGLTGLANRRLLKQRFYAAVEQTRHSHMPFALLMIDLNGFKQINDYYSHAAGDAVLITMGKRLVGSVRASDTVARLGGDEFVLLIEGIENQQDLTQIGKKLLETLSAPMPLSAGVVLNVSASIGLALYPEDGTGMEDLLHTADVAMYECKSSGLPPL
jgi:diguanylate cyclase (GGDEF)-like protein